MITKTNLKQLLKSLNFEEKDDKFTKQINGAKLSVDFKNESLHYPDAIKIHDKTTSNFSHPENFVVFECVHRLLEKGYEPKHLELEPRWNLGRDAKGGKADILVRDNLNNPYLIIECKTTEKGFKGEFGTEWDRMKSDGGQLFSYLQQEKATKYLCLYASDFNETLEFQNYIIQVFDDEEFLEAKKIKQSYKNAANNQELFLVWKESYEFEHKKRGIFENNANAYQILEAPLTFSNLEDFTDKGHYNEFAKILRKHNISGKENAFDKLVNIFLCKIYDESFNKNNLNFGYRGVTADNYTNMQERLMLLYKQAMEEFLDEKITFISNEDVEDKFQKLNLKDLKDTIKDYIKELKFYSNNDFAFLEVHNRELFLKNALVLKDIIELFQNYKLTQNSTNQFLGELFELFLQKGMKQDEGQFFTPIAICEFIIYSLPLKEMLGENFTPLKVIDYACGAGHFLNTYANEIKNLAKQKLSKQELKDNLVKHYENIYGIEKEYRLSKVSKVSSAMYGQKEINILYADALASKELAYPATEEGQKQKPQILPYNFDLLIANPPYSVKGFLETLNKDNKKEYTLYNETNINENTNNAIECFFCERARQILKDNAKAAIILPSSILNKDSIYKSTREILFQNFDFIAIVELGSQTFGATGTNTIILFLSKKNASFKQGNIPQDYSLIFNRVKNENLKDNEIYIDNGYIEKYCDFRGFDKELYETFLNNETLEKEAKETLFKKLLEKDAFKDYQNAFKQTSDYKKLKQENQTKEFLKYAKNIEKEKLVYFALSLNQEVLLIKSPSDNKEQKKFLGYEWSNRKGDEGLKELNDPYLTPLFERGNPNNENKLAHLIREAFLYSQSQIPQDLSLYAQKARLIDMMDFDKVEFNKAISLNPNQTQSDANPFIHSKYELVRLGEVCDLLNGYAFKKTDYVEKSNTLLIRMGNIRPKGEFDANYKTCYLPDDFAHKYKSYILNDNDIIIAMTDMGNAMNILGVPTIVKKQNNENLLLNQRVGKLFNISNKIKVNYLKIILQTNEAKNFFKSMGYGGLQINLGKTQILSLKIPLPPLEIQKEIVAKCQNIDERYNTLRMSIEEYQRLIKAVLKECGITEETNGGIVLFLF